MKPSSFQSMIASGLLLVATFAMAQDSKPVVKKAARSKTAQARAEKAKAKAAIQTVDINRASKDELKTLPGITDALAEKIIAGRPYLTKARLVTNNVISEGIYQGIKDQVVAGYLAPGKKP